MILVKVDARDLANVKGLEKTIPEALYKSVEEIAINAQNELRNQITLKDLNWRGMLLRRTKARRRSKGIWYVVMPEYGVAVDRMRPHWVALKKGRKITQWAQEKGLEFHGKSFIYPFVSGSIYVRPHPFIEHSLYLVSRRIRRIVTKNLNQIRR